LFLSLTRGGSVGEKESPKLRQFCFLV